MFASDRTRRRTCRRTVAPRQPGLMVKLALALAVGCMGASHAADGDRSQEQLRRLKQQLRQVQQQQEAAVAEAQTKAATEKASLSKTLQAAQGEAAAQRQAAGAAARRIKEQGAEIDTLKETLQARDAELTQLKQSLETLKSRAEATQAQAATELALWQGRQRQTGEALSQCRTHNAELTALGEQLLQRYDDKGVLDMLNAGDPVLQWGRVRLENARAAYQDKIDTLKLDAPPAAGPAR